MSAYIHFFIKGSDRFYPIATYSRNNKHYEYFSNFAPWEAVAPLDQEQLTCIKSNIKDEIEHLNKRLKETEKFIEAITKFNNSVEEKLEAVNEQIEFINYCKEEIKQNEQVIFFIHFLNDMIDNVSDSKYYDDIESIDPNKYVWVGIECGSFPTFDMIKE